LLDDTADVILLQSDLDGLIMVRKLAARAHLARLLADYRKVYTGSKAFSAVAPRKHRQEQIY